MIVFNKAPAEKAKAKARQVTPEEFFGGIKVGHGAGIQCIVLEGRNGTPNDHQWNMHRANFAVWASVTAKARKPAYFSMAAYKADSVGRYNGRTEANVLAVRGFCFDMEASAEKYAKPNGPNEGYPDAKAAMMAFGVFLKATGLIPNYLLETGSGGLHAHFVLSQCLTVQEWKGRARALVALAAMHRLKIDAQCTTDAARIMRAPGSIHQKTGVEVVAHAWRADTYPLSDFDTLVNYIPASDPLGLAPHRKYDLTVNDDLKPTRTPFSYLTAAKECKAMHRAAADHGADTAYPVWILAARTADLSEEGRELAHSISAGHPDYDEGETDKKLTGLTGGPANCATWAVGYGAGGPCDSCTHRGKIKNPAIQLGAVAYTEAPGALAVAAPETLVEYVVNLNKRFAVLRHGSKCVVVDFQTPSIGGTSISRGVGFLDYSAFRALHSGLFAPAIKLGDKPRALADAWLSHLGRRQYDGMVFAPGRTLPESILNMWQGFAVEPVKGDVSLWLEVLAALVPKPSDREYVLKWYAWKVQNPGSGARHHLDFSRGQRHRQGGTARAAVGTIRASRHARRRPGTDRRAVHLASDDSGIRSAGRGHFRWQLAAG